MSTGYSKYKTKTGRIEIQNVKEAIYLGQLISHEDKTKKEVNRRINLAWAKFWGLKYIFEGKYSEKLEGEYLIIV